MFATSLRFFTVFEFIVQLHCAVGRLIHVLVVGLCWVKDGPGGVVLDWKMAYVFKSGAKLSGDVNNACVIEWLE